MNDNRRLFALPQAGEVLGISPWTLRKHIKRGTVKAVRCGRRVLLSAATIAEIQANGLPSIKVAA